MSKIVAKILLTISETEEQLQNIRQLLNEEIEFNMPDLIDKLFENEAKIDCQDIRKFIGSTQEIIIKEIESMIRYYSTDDSLMLTPSEFSKIFLCRQNKLLAKMVLQREKYGSIPKYIHSYCKKLIIKECNLHGKCISYRREHSTATQQWLQYLENSTQSSKIDTQKIRQFCRNTYESIDEGKIDLMSDVLTRYFTLGSPDEGVKVERLQRLLTMKNCKVIQQLIDNSQSNISTFFNRDLRISKANPFVDKDFVKLLDKPKQCRLMFSIRQIQSIQKHLQRHSNSKGKPRHSIPNKIQQFKENTEHQISKVLSTIKHILRIEKQTQQLRRQLNECADFYPQMFFSIFNKDSTHKIIPSAMSYYFNCLNIKVKMKQIFLFFKRQSNKFDGKLDLQSFVSIFKCAHEVEVVKDKKIRKLEEISLETKRKFLICLIKSIKNEGKIDILKMKLTEGKKVDLRDAFCCIDSDQDGYISLTDIEVSWVKFQNQFLSKQQAKLMWFRLGSRNLKQMIKYEYFVQEMMPKNTFNQKKKRDSVKTR